MFLRKREKEYQIDVGLLACVQLHILLYDTVCTNDNVALTVNCRYAQTAIHELSSSQRGTNRKLIDKTK